MHPAQHAALHPSVKQLLIYFVNPNLPPELQAVAQPFADLAEKVALARSGPETTTAIRKLLEAKDCAVRAQLNEPEGVEPDSYIKG